MAWSKRLLELSVTFAVDQLPSWDEREINWGVENAQIAVRWWNRQPIPLEFAIKEYASMACIGWESMDYYQLFTVADRELEKGRLLLLLRSAMAFGGFARFDRYALCVNGGVLGGRMIHKLGHLLGASDHAVWGEHGWECDPEPDVMCRGIVSERASWRTLYEIVRAEGA